MRIFVTGATGYIGRNLIKRLRYDYDVYAIVRNTSDVQGILNDVKGIVVYEKNMIYQEFEKIRPDVLIHLAGVFYSEHTQDNIEKLLECNVVFTTIIFDAAVKAGCKKIINTGTYWQNYNGEQYNPVNLYAATKQAAEDILLYYVKANVCEGITLQIFDTYGANDHRKKILNTIQQMRDGETIDMSGGDQKLFLCYIDDVIEGYMQALQLVKKMNSGEYKKYALRAERPVRLRNIVDACIKIENKKIIVNWGKLPYRNKEIMDPSEMGEILPGWSPKISLEEGLRLMGVQREV